MEKFLVTGPKTDWLTLGGYGYILQRGFSLGIGKQTNKQTKKIGQDKLNNSSAHEITFIMQTNHSLSASSCDWSEDKTYKPQDIAIS